MVGLLTALPDTQLWRRWKRGTPAGRKARAITQLLAKLRAKDGCGSTGCRLSIDHAHASRQPEEYYQRAFDSLKRRRCLSLGLRNRLIWFKTSRRLCGSRLSLGRPGSRAQRILALFCHRNREKSRPVRRLDAAGGNGANHFRLNESLW